KLLIKLQVFENEDTNLWEETTFQENNEDIPVDILHDECLSDTSNSLEHESLLGFDKHLTKIHKDNMLSKEQRAAILKQEPRNFNIKYLLLTMNKRIWKLLSPQSRESDKVIAKISYRTSAVLCLLDNVLRALYQSKPPNSDYSVLQAWEDIETSFTNTQTLLFDTLLHYLLLMTRDGNREDLKDLVERENATNNFINKAFRNKAHALNRSNTKPLTTIIIRKTDNRVLRQVHLGTRHRILSNPEQNHSWRKVSTTYACMEGDIWIFIAKRQDNEIIEQKIQMIIQKGQNNGYLQRIQDSTQKTTYSHKKTLVKRQKYGAKKEWLGFFSYLNSREPVTTKMVDQVPFRLEQKTAHKHARINSDSLCLQGFQESKGSNGDNQCLASEIFLQVFKSELSGSRCLGTMLDDSNRLSEFTINNDTQNLVQGHLQQSNYSSSNTVLAIGNIVFNTIGLIDRFANPVDRHKTISTRIDQQSTTSSQSQVECVHLSYLQKNFKKKGFSDKAVKLLEEVTIKHPMLQSVSRLRGSWFGAIK
ncbi:558_t:CDS:2, partial [Racocetra persica]